MFRRISQFFVLLLCLGALGAASDARIERVEKGFAPIPIKGEAPLKLELADWMNVLRRPSPRRSESCRGRSSRPVQSASRWRPRLR